MFPVVAILFHPYLTGVCSPDLHLT